MRHPERLLLAIVAAALGALLWACDEQWSGDDALTDMSVVDSPGDSTTDTAVDTGATCPYPEGPYSFSAQGDIVPPMRWPSAPGGLTETLGANLAQLHCDPEVKSVFILLTNTT